MGKKRLAVIGEKTKKEESYVEKKAKQAIKAGKGQGRIKDMGQVALEEAKRIEEKEKKLEQETKQAVVQSVKEETKPKRARKTKSKNYLQAKAQIDRNKVYSLKKAVALAKKTSITKFMATVELHLTVKEAGLSGEIDFPHTAGKSQKIAIADDQLLEKIKKGKIDFDVLLASPAMMPKLAPLAKILGPKGLMPNPKKGTITDNPKQLAKQMTGKTHFKTEKKSPLIHLVVGKIDQPEKKLVANITTAFKAVGAHNILKAVLTTTMGPGIKLRLG